MGIAEFDARMAKGSAIDRFDAATGYQGQRTPTEFPLGSAQNPLNKQHPNLPNLTRMKLMTLASTTPQQLQREASKLGFDAVNLEGLNLAIKEKGKDESWHRVEPTGWQGVGEFAKDIGDVTADIGIGVTQTAGEVLGAAGGLLTGPFAPAAVPAGIITGGSVAATGAEGIRQMVARMAGVGFEEGEAASGLKREAVLGAASSAVMLPFVGRGVGKAGGEVLIKFKTGPRVATSPEHIAKATDPTSIKKILGYPMEGAGAIRNRVAGKLALPGEIKQLARDRAGQQLALDTAVDESTLGKSLTAQEAHLDVLRRRRVESAVQATREERTANQLRGEIAEKNLKDNEVKLARVEKDLKNAKERQTTARIAADRATRASARFPDPKAPEPPPRPAAPKKPDLPPTRYTTENYRGNIAPDDLTRKTYATPEANAADEWIARHQLAADATGKAIPATFKARWMSPGTKSRSKEAQRFLKEEGIPTYVTGKEPRLRDEFKEVTVELGPKGKNITTETVGNDDLISFYDVERQDVISLRLSRFRELMAPDGTIFKIDPVALKDVDPRAFARGDPPKPPPVPKPKEPSVEEVISRYRNSETKERLGTATQDVASEARNRQRIIASTGGSRRSRATALGVQEATEATKTQRFHAEYKEIVGKYGKAKKSLVSDRSALRRNISGGPKFKNKPVLPSVEELRRRVMRGERRVKKGSDLAISIDHVLRARGALSTVSVAGAAIGLPLAPAVGAAVGAPAVMKAAGHVMEAILDSGGKFLQRFDPTKRKVILAAYHKGGVPAARAVIASIIREDPELREIVSKNLE